MTGGRREIYQVGEKSFVAVRPVRGSPSYLVEECYPTEESPTGWHTTGVPTYTERARSPEEAAQEWLDGQRKGVE